MSVSAAELISKHKFKILSGLGVVSGSAAVAGVYFMPESPIENLNATSPIADIADAPVEPEKIIEIIKATEKKIEEREEEKPAPEIASASIPVTDVKPIATEPTPQPVAMSATSNISDVQSTGESTEKVEYTDEDFGKAKWSDMEIIPHDSKLELWKSRENIFIVAFESLVNNKEQTLFKYFFKTQEFQDALKKMVSEKNSSNRNGSTLRDVCVKNYTVKFQDIKSTDKSRKAKADDIMSWCSRRQIGLTE